MQKKGYSSKIQSMKYAVIEINGSQFRVQEGEKIITTRLPTKEGETVDSGEILLSSINEEVKIGKPKVLGVTVNLKVLKHYLGKKMDIFKFKAKTGYRRRIGFRPDLTLLEVTKISA